MRILMSIHHTLDLDAGAAGVTMRLAEALRARGHDVDLFSFDRLGGPDHRRRHVYPWRLAWHLRRHAAAYDVLDLSSGDGWVYGLLPSPERPAIVTRSHGLEHRYHTTLLAEHALGRYHLSWKYGLYNGGFRLWEVAMSFCRADLCVMLNPTDAEHVVSRFGVAPERVVITRNGIPDHMVAHAAALAAKPPDPAMRPRHIAFVGSYLMIKGVDYLRAAMCRVLAENPEATLGYFGVKVAPETILATYPEALRPRISVVSCFDNRVLPKILADRHILVISSLTEGYHVAGVEAMACGLVPVTSDTPGPTVYVHDGETGLVYPTRDASRLAEAVAELLRNPARWAKLRANALALATRQSWAGVATETEQHYEIALRNRRDRLLPQGSAVMALKS